MIQRILVLCTGNSCRSVIAEALFNHLGKEKVEAVSAGSDPTGYVHPKSIETLKRHGIHPDNLRSKSWNEFKNQSIDILITVCDNVAGETCPIFSGKPIKAHWGVPNPVRVQGPPIEIEAEFDRVFTMLEHRVKALLCLPLEQMGKDELQQRLNEIGVL